MRLLPEAFEKVINAFMALPGVGPRSAERYTYYLFKNSPTAAKTLSTTLASLSDGVKLCPVTHALISADQKISPLYDNPDRDKTMIAVVAEPFDIIALERTGHFQGTYHVLGGLVSPIDGIGPDQLNISSLMKRVVKDKVKEIIIATNASVEGETTALLLQQTIGQSVPKLTRIARGLPVGVDLEYTDLITLSRALDGRTKL